MGWNGADLVTDFSAELGDTSTGFKAKVLGWINDGLREIGTSHEWPFLKERGKVILTTGQDTHSLPLSQPAAPTLAALAGGTLALVAYKVLVTFYEGASGVESVAGVESASITPAAADLSITVSAIPVSTSTLVTARKVYLSKDGAAFFLYSTIANNTATTTTITADTLSTQTPPDENAIFKVDGDFYIDGTRVLYGTSLHALRFETNGVVPNGQPQYWAPVNQEEIVVTPKPTSATTLTFYYYKLPAKVFNVATSQPQMPSWMYQDLKNYVIWRGYSYRDRAGQESKEINYRESIKTTISRKGKPVKRSGRVRCVAPDSDGYAV